MRFHSLCWTIVLSISLTGFAQAQNWPRFRGENGNGVATGKDIPNEFSTEKGIVFKLPIPGKGNSSPVLWGKQLFLQTSKPDGSERILLCVDVTRPEIVWQRSIPGHKAHTHDKNSLASATPATDGEHVYAAMWDGDTTALWCYTVKGDPVWNVNLGKFVSQHGAGASPVVYKDFVYYADDMDKKSRLYCFDKRTGKEVWAKDREAFRACYGAPFILEENKANPELVVSSSMGITGYDPAKGTVLWDYKWDWSLAKKKDFPLRTIAGTLHVDGLLLACAGDGGGDRLMTALQITGAGDKTTVSKVWHNKKDFPYVPCLLLREGHIYYVTDAGFAGCYDLKGNRKWYERAAPGKVAFTGSPILIDDRMFAVDESGDVHVIASDPKSFNVLGRSSLGEMVRSTPAVADGRLYIRGSQHLFCIGKK